MHSVTVDESALESDELEVKRYWLIDVARIMSIAAVFVYHFNIGSTSNAPYQSFRIGNFAPNFHGKFIDALTSYGYLGLDTFFFISGLVIARTFKDRTADEFLLARFRRLLFPYLLVFFATAIIYFCFSTKSISLYSIILDISISARWNDSPMVVAVAWTLTIEILFYAICSIFLTVRTILVKFNIHWELRHFFTIWLILLYFLKEQNISYPTNMIFLEGYSELFVAGALSHMILSRKVQGNRPQSKTSFKNIHEKTKTSILNCSLLIIAYTQCFVHFQDVAGKIALYPPINVSFLCTFFILILAMSQNFPPLPKAIMSILEKLGIATYTFYLLHQTVGMFIAVVILQNISDNYSHVAFLTSILLLLASLGVESLNIWIWERIQRTKWSAETELQEEASSENNSDNESLESNLWLDNKNEL